MKKGFILATSLAILGVVLILTTSALTVVNVETTASNRSLQSKSAYSVAEAAIDKAIASLNSNQSFTGEGPTSFGNGEYVVTVSGSSSLKRIEATAYIPTQANPRQSSKIVAEAQLSGENVQFFYGVQVDGGGITMANNSSIAGNVYSNGNIIGSNGATITGDVVVAGGINDNPQDSWTVSNADNDFASSNSNRDIAQSFTTTASGTLGLLALQLGKVGNPTNNPSVYITADNGNKPDTNILASATIPYTSVGGTQSWINVTFATPPTLANNTKYWIVIDTSHSSGTNYWRWSKDTSDSYASNSGKYNSSWTNASWSNINSDLNFKAWIGGTPTKIENVAIGVGSGSNATGTATANSFISTTVRGVNCPNAYCVIGNPSQQALPISDGVIQDWKDQAIAGGEVGSYTLDNGATGSLGPKKISGTLSLSNNAVLTLTGSIWVTGNITLSNNCRIRLDPAYGSNSGVIITDGTVVIDNNCAFEGADTGSYVLLLSSRDDKSGISMQVANNSDGVIYYAGKSRISFSQNSTAKEATAWGMNLDNNAVVTYESGLASALFTNGPGGGWSIKPGSWHIIR